MLFKMNGLCMLFFLLVHFSHYRVLFGCSKRLCTPQGCVLVATLGGVHLPFQLCCRESSDAPVVFQDGQWSSQGSYVHDEQGEMIWSHLAQRRVHSGAKHDAACLLQHRARRKCHLAASDAYFGFSECYQLTID